MKLWVLLVVGKEKTRLGQDQEDKLQITPGWDNNKRTVEKANNLLPCFLHFTAWKS